MGLLQASKDLSNITHKRLANVHPPCGSYTAHPSQKSLVSDIYDQPVWFRFSSDLDSDGGVIVMVVQRYRCYVFHAVLLCCWPDGPQRTARWWSTWSTALCQMISWIPDASLKVLDAT